MIQILIVDDEKIERNGIKFLLKQLHMEAEIREAVNGVKALEALDGVEVAEVSHEAGTAIVTLSADVSDEILTKAVEDKDYKVLSIA